MDDRNNLIELDTSQLIKEIPLFSQKHITEFMLHDRSLSKDRKGLESIIKTFIQKAPDVFVSLRIDVNILDIKMVQLLSQLYCSLEIPVEGTVKNDVLLFDKKLYSSKAKMLNDAGIVFGFDMCWACQKCDTFKAFRERLNFVLTLYPNHIDFPQLYDDVTPKCTGVYSSKDIDFTHGMAFACQTFYSAGRAVPWFNTVLKPLKIEASAFFSDFEEWQQCNNCSYESGFNIENTSYAEIEKMQLSFLLQKYEEKNRKSLFNAVKDLIKLNGAFSRVALEGEESIVETSYNPDDILSPYALDLIKFCDNVTMESCQVKVFASSDSPDYRIL